MLTRNDEVNNSRKIGVKVEKLVCIDCKAEFEVRTEKRGSAFIEFILWSTLVIPGYFYGLWRKPQTKKTCDYCGSNFLLPASSAYDLLAISKKNNLT